MKKCNITGVHRKIQFLGSSRKTSILVKKGPKKGAWTVCRFIGGLGEKEEVVLRGGLISQCTLCIIKYIDYGYGGKAKWKNTKNIYLFLKNLITSTQFRLTKVLAEMKSDTEQKMKLE